MFLFDGITTALLAASLVTAHPSTPPSYASPPGYASPQASAYCTSSDLTYKLSSITAPAQGNGNANGQQVFNLTIDDTSSGYKQTLDGFGAAVTDATVVSFSQLSSSSLDTLLNTLMTSSGANFSLMRHTIGASDLSPDPPYTYDENGGMGKADPGLANFTLTSAGTAMANLLAKMKGKNGGLTVVGSPWSAPSWMKKNRRLIGDTTNNNLQDRYLNSSETDYSNYFAQYFVKYIQAFANLGVTVNAITLQNEPLYSASGYPTMYMYDYEQGNLIKNFVGPQLSSAGLSTSIWAYDHNTDVPTYPQTVLNTASSYTTTVAWHCYAGNVDWSTLTAFRANNTNISGLKQYMTECWTPATDSTNWFQAANFTIGPLQNWANGVIAWTLAANSTNGPHLSTGGCANCQGLVRINDDGSVTFNLAYYLMAQFSRFMPKGAIVLSMKGYSPTSYKAGLQAVGSLNPDKTRTVVMMNTLTSAVFVRLMTGRGQMWSGSLPKSSVVTWVLPAVS
ncbi:hypothetical protein PRZ48_012795 [Zasmidium cellare]|uniref:Glycoside hydrolase family 30 protein n=1 Tax=Zasmidium cellare TaxID=395010 RepID=A0ABR0E6G6_ZASCE|nr:hypothetical protein PRZ48_012795 [Zasmidium cellare]